MSSQGGATKYSGVTGPAIQSGYAFKRESFRDSSDWTTFLKQKHIVQEGPVGGTPIDPWIPYGGDRRLDYLNGRYKRAAFPNCPGCTGAAFNGNGSPYTS
jgi:hypothetical protein